MNIKIQDFFKPVKVDKPFVETDHKKVEHLIDFARSLSEITYQSIYLIDYYKRGFIYVSNNPIFLCGNKPEHVLRDGYMFYMKNVPEKDLELLLKINEVGFSFFDKLPIELRSKYSISYDFHLTQPGGNLMLVNHKLKPVLLDRNGNPWIALCIVSLSANNEAGNIRFKSDELNKSFQFNLVTDSWEEIERARLNKGEKEVLILSAQGLTTEQIAARTFLSVDAIKFRKKSIFTKLKVKNITEAITAAIDLALL